MFSDADADGEPDDSLKDDRHELEYRLPLTIKLPAGMARSVVDGAAGPRRSTRNRKSSDSFANPSGSEYSAGDASASSPMTSRPSRKKHVVYDDEDDEETYKVEKVEIEYRTARGRQTTRPSYLESDDDGLKNDLFGEDDDVDVVDHSKRPSRPIKRNLRGGGHRRVNSDDEGEADASVAHIGTRSRSKKTNSTSASPPMMADGDGDDAALGAPSGRRLTRSATSRLTRKSARQLADEGGYEDGADLDGPGSSEEELLDDDVHTSPSPEPTAEEASNPKQYKLRKRKHVNYAIPPPLEEVQLPPSKAGSKPNRGKGRAGPGWSVNGVTLSRYMGMNVPADDSDSDAPARTPRKPLSAGAGGGLFAAGGGGGLFPDSLAAAGTPSNLGKVSDAALADADPLGVNANVTFDEVGGLDDHINSLKEMTLLPLLYPEVFQRFNLTPPRGVLFHGPPGTGKTLLARALAASCRSNGKGIAFFMRKGADCLSKWVGEAERQLRLLFEEARNQQPSIIFFDEIDGLAPVRSSKQDQIHASIVSTLLALMDGMDGRGQVIVIGATNRPDAVDPALRRPGRFDREFYFPLPNIDARAKILSIITHKWEGWEEKNAKEAIQRLAKITKGYGGADLRALCTEAALNAVQRRYPQIYKSNDRLLLKPETIGVQARDFMISVKNDVLQRVKEVVEKVLPLGKKRTALEEAEYEDEGDEGALEREILLQKMEMLRVYRPRIVLHGDAGMGQVYIGSAVLHHLEGYHVQTLDLGSLMGDSTRTVEAGIVQLFIEAKRHQPSVIYVPSLLGWCAAVSETARTTVKAMLDTLSPSDPILLLAVVDGPFISLPRDVRSWFGATRENRVLFSHPDPDKRRTFFTELLNDVRRPPTQFPDGVKRKKRVLEELPIAPPLEPRQPTVAELAVQEENDQRILTLLKYRLGPILTELKRKHKRFTKPARDEYNLHPETHWDPFLTVPQPQHVDAPMTTEAQLNGIIVIDGADGTHPEVRVNGAHDPPAEPELFEVDLESMNVDLYKGKYLTPNMFLEDIGRMVYNAEMRKNEDHERLNKAQSMFTAAQVSIQEFDPGFRLECERMAGRECQRREQRRAEKERSRAGSREGSTNGHGSGLENGAHIRRSARNNGLQPEIGITDPLKLERQLKRQRSHDANGDANGSGSGEDSIDDRDAKRSRVEPIAEDNRDYDEINILGPTSSQIRPATVRFATDINDDPQTPTRANGHHILHDHLAPIAEVYSESRHSGFDPNLLNPAISQAPLPSLQSLIDANPMNDFSNSLPSLVSEQQFFPPANNMFDFSHQLQPGASEMLIMPTGMDRAIDPSLNFATPQPQTPHRSPAPTATIEQIEQPQLPPRTETPPILMEVEAPRPPSPPPPEFHVDEALLSQLETKFVGKTGQLNVEELEQLRAISLGCIWRHRQEWDRDACVRELFSVIDEFVEEAVLVEMDD
ncbi:hypothetical protein EW145_g4792 [Phellinidium pouzarii]|uniref:AAA+ ATPase domain-containing protein n=1 Tax=Phellinidium pouzarii TaxID=167371 RepID=A0A4S4L2T0_9AGAM|nr:hypothetical protein EW145_g4792 [Phellinidium pouzarii]